MRKLVITAVLSLLVTPAMADGYYRHDHYHYNRGGGGGGGGNWVAPLVGGMILGGILEGMNQPRYAQPYQQQFFDDQPICRRVFAGYDYYGRPHFRVFCD
jgi:hypothetical protein